LFIECDIEIPEDKHDYLNAFPPMPSKGASTRKKFGFGTMDGAELEILVGAKVYAEILTGNSHRFENGLMAIETSLGWTVFGQEKEKPRLVTPTREP